MPAVRNALQEKACLSETATSGTIMLDRDCLTMLAFPFSTLIRELGGIYEACVLLRARPTICQIGGTIGRAINDQQLMCGSLFEKLLEKFCSRTCRRVSTGTACRRAQKRFQ